MIVMNYLLISLRGNGNLMQPGHLTQYIHKPLVECYNTMYMDQENARLV